MTHTWKVYNLERVKSNGMVTSVTWACESEIEGASERHIGYSVLSTGSISDENFIDYDNLKENIVLGWVTGSIDQSTIQTANSASIANIVINQNAITKSEGIPW